MHRRKHIKGAETGVTTSEDDRVILRQHSPMRMQIVTTLDFVTPTCSCFVQGKTAELAYDEGCSN